LDPETLRVVVDAIEKLSGGGRLVGKRDNSHGDGHRGQVERAPAVVDRWLEHQEREADETERDRGGAEEQREPGAALPAVLSAGERQNELGQVRRSAERGVDVDVVGRGAGLSRRTLGTRRRPNPVKRNAR